MIDVGGEVVAGIGNLRLVANKNPGLSPDARHFELEQIGIGVETAMNPCGRNHLTKITCWYRSH